MMCLGLVFYYLSSLVFSQLPGSTVWCLTLVWENSQFLLFKYFFPFLSLCLVFLLPIGYNFCSFSTVLGYSVMFFQSLLFVFHFWKFLLRYSLTQRFSPQLFSMMSNKIIKIILHFYCSVLILAFLWGDLSECRSLCYIGHMILCTIFFIY